MTKTLAFFLTAALSTACAGQAEVRYSGDGTRPQLVAMDDNPDVSVVANSDEPMFFTDNSFWLYRDNTWWRSSSHRTGFTRAEAPPERVTRIHQPAGYIHYRHAETTPRTGFNERAPRQDLPAGETHAPQEQQLQQPPGPPQLPSHEPNPEGPVPPRANPLPPTQVPPVVPN